MVKECSCKHRSPRFPHFIPADIHRRRQKAICIATEQIGRWCWLPRISTVPLGSDQVWSPLDAHVACVAS
jgi:hypothetical protein